MLLRTAFGVLIVIVSLSSVIGFTVSATAPLARSTDTCSHHSGGVKKYLNRDEAWRYNATISSRRLAKVFKRLVVKAYYELALNNPSISIVLSGSFPILLALILSAAKGDTFSQLQEICVFPNPLSTNLGTKRQLKYLDSHNNNGDDDTVKIFMTNQMFISDDIKVAQNFECIAEIFYRKALTRVDFTDPSKAVRQINARVSTETKNKISGMLSTSAVTAENKLTLINAVSIHARWLNSFNNVGFCDFHIKKPNITVQVQCMTRVAVYGVQHFPTMRGFAIQVPMRSPDHVDYQFIWMCPDKPMEISEFLQDGFLDPATFHSVLVNINSIGTKRLCELTMPKLKFKPVPIDIAQVLHHGFNITTLQTPFGNFKGMSHRIFGLNSFHSLVAPIEFDEKGTVGTGSSHSTKTKETSKYNHKRLQNVKCKIAITHSCVFAIYDTTQKFAPVLVGHITPDSLLIKKARAAGGS